MLVLIQYQLQGKWRQYRYSEPLIFTGVTFSEYGWIVKKNANIGCNPEKAYCAWDRNEVRTKLQWDTVGQTQVADTAGGLKVKLNKTL